MRQAVESDAKVGQVVRKDSERGCRGYFTEFEVCAVAAVLSAVIQRTLRAD